MVITMICRGNLLCIDFRVYSSFQQFCKLLLLSPYVIVNTCKLTYYVVSFRKSESYIFPSFMEITVPNLVQFVLSNLTPEERVWTLLVVCEQGSKRQPLSFQVKLFFIKYSCFHLKMKCDCPEFYIIESTFGKNELS